MLTGSESVKTNCRRGTAVLPLPHCGNGCRQAFCPCTFRGRLRIVLQEGNATVTCLLRKTLLTATICAHIVWIAGCANGEGATSMNNKAKRVIRKASGAGRWFPASQNELRSMVKGFIEDAQIDAPQGRIVAALAPHAGYIYSGKVAGYTFRAIRDNAAAGSAPDTVVILGLSHRQGFSGVALMDGDAIETPLGETALDRDAADYMAAQSPTIFADYSPHAREHSAENEIPFVQTALPNARLVVGLIGDHDETTVNDLVSALGKLAKKKHILIVASTDLLHDPDYQLVTRTDKATLAGITALDDKGILKAWQPSRQICCGISPVVAAMRFAASQGCREGQLLYYRNSGDDFPESRGQWVVGYGAVVFAVKNDQ